MSNSIRRDILTAAPVAFRESGELDVAGSRRILENIAGSGVQGAFVLGTTGEFVALTLSERRVLTQLSLEILQGLNVVVHVGAPSLYQVRKLVEQTRELGAASIAVLTPYYFPAGPKVILDFYTRVSEAAAGLRVFVYVFPARTGNMVSPQLLARLAQLPNIVGAKISGLPLETIASYRAAVENEFLLYTGVDRDLARAASYGVQGVVSGISSVFPKVFVELVAALESGDEARVIEAQAAVDDVADVIKGDPGFMKVGLRLQGISAGSVRMAIEGPGVLEIAEIKRAVLQYS